MTSTLVLGGPGTGKTTRLIELVMGFIEAGVRPERIAFVSFTRAAVNEARDKAVTRFNLSEDDMQWFRTLHSLCFKILNLNRGQVFGLNDRVELAELTGESTREDDPLMTLSIRSRTTMRGLQGEWEVSPEEAQWFRLKRFHEANEAYRRDRSVYDFTDMLQLYLGSAIDGPCPVDVAVVDEAQDLSRLQWLVVEKAFADSREVYYAGDDDQCVHAWAGADMDYFMNLSVDRTEVLPVSHRLPKPVFDLSQEVGGRISRRYHKPVRSSGKAGTLEWLARLEEVDLSSGSWLLLARARYQLATLANEARYQGVVHTVSGEPTVDEETVKTIRAYETLRRGGTVNATDAKQVLTAVGLKRTLGEGTYSADDLQLDVKRIWHDALVEIGLDEREYYLSCLRRGERLDGVPRVQIDTVHSAKGREADNVLLLTDSTSRIAKAFVNDEDSEHRVWYVGVTRASQNLYVVTQKTRYGYRL